MKRRPWGIVWVLGFVAGMFLGASLTAHAATDLERYAERIARALERIATVAEHGKAP